MKSENLTAQESLDIITSMIQQAKGKARQNAFHFLLWGWVIMLANLGMYTLNLIGYEHPYVVWVITIPAWIVSMYKGYSQGREEGVSTYFGRITVWLWVSFGICIFTCVAFGNKLNYQLNPLIITITAIPTFVSGVLLRFRPIMFGGVAFWIFGIVGFLTPLETQPLIGAIAILCGYLVPGYLLRSKKD